MAQAGMASPQDAARPTGGAMIQMIVLGTIVQIAMVVSGHYVAFVKNHVFALGGMGISLLFGGLYARTAAETKGAAAAGGALVGGACALIGIAVSFMMGDVPAEVMIFGTLGSAVTGAVGGLLFFVLGRRH